MRRSVVLGNLLLVGTMLGAAAEKTQQWRELGFNSVLDINTSHRVHAKIVSTQGMAFLWGGTAGERGAWQTISHSPAGAGVAYVH